MSLARVCATALLAAAVLPLSVQAGGQPVQPRGPAMMAPGGGMMGQGAPRQGMGPGSMGTSTPRPFAGVEFSEKQRKTIQAMMENERKSHQQRVEKMRGVQEQLQKLYMADKWDSKAITKLYEKMHAEQRKTIAAMAEARNKVYDLMSKEQREQMKQYQQQQVQRFAAPAQPRPLPTPQQ